MLNLLGVLFNITNKSVSRCNVDQQVARRKGAEREPRMVPPSTPAPGLQATLCQTTLPLRGPVRRRSPHHLRQ